MRKVFVYRLVQWGDNWCDATKKAELIDNGTDDTRSRNDREVWTNREYWKGLEWGGVE